MRRVDTLPKWADLLLLPLINISVAFFFSGLLIAALGENPLAVLDAMIKGAFVYRGGLGYTLYYTTNFIFTGLAVAIAFHAKQFNIGGEGQAALGGLGAALAAIYLAPFLPALLLIPLIVLASALFGAAWGFVPGYLQAKRGSHIVITTIMFNFIAAALLVALLSGPMMQPGQMSPQSINFASNALIPKVYQVAQSLGIKIARSPFNFSFVLALVVAFGIWVLIWRTRFGYAVRAIGANEEAARYAGIYVPKVTMIVMAISGALAGMMAINEVIGSSGRLILNFTAGYGFIGIAVALIGRNHPLGIVFAALLFGFLIQGGSEISFTYPNISREMVLVIQGLIILFSGALNYLFSPLLIWFFSLVRPQEVSTKEKHKKEEAEQNA